MLGLDAVAELADNLPLSSIERHRADLPLVMPGGAPEIGGPPSETVRGIEHNGCWMVLWNIEDAPEYARILNDLLDEAEQSVGLRPGDMRNRQAFLFLSAPNAVTPVHFDPEHNFLLQIRGEKEMNVGKFVNREEERRELERYYSGGHRNLELIPEDATSFRMSPGDGVYVPSFAPHFVRNGSDVSVSLSITFRTRASERNENVHRLNARLRRFNRSPRPAGQSRTADWTKAAIVSAADRLRGKRAGRREKPPAQKV